MQCLEVNSMRALFLNDLGRHIEAQAVIKKILFKNLTNFTCWHVYGMITRKLKDYETAKKAYMNASKYNPSNESMLRDLSNIQIFLRDYQGFQETRRQLLVKDPSKSETWIAYAAGCYLAQDYDNCLSTLDSIIRINAEDSKQKKPLKPEHELEIYTMQVKCLEQKGEHEKAIASLQKNEKYFIDQS